MTVRIDALTRDLVPQAPVSWQKLDLKPLFDVPGSFTLIVPATTRNWQLVTFDSQGEYIAQAFLVDWNGVYSTVLLAEQWQHDLVVDPNTGLLTETITFTGSDMLALLANRVMFVDGTQFWSDQPTAPRVISGPAETVIKTVIRENTVNAGNTYRQIPNFTVATDQGRGGTVAYTITPPLPSTNANLLTGDNADFNNSLGTWQGETNCTTTQTSARAHGGGESMKMTAAGNGDMTAVSCPAAHVTTQGVPVRPGDSVSLQAWLRADSTARTVFVGADFYDISGSFLSTAYTGQQSDATTGWSQPAGSVVAPDSAVFARVNVKVQNCNNGEVHYVDDVSTTGSGAVTGTRYASNLGRNLMDLVRTVARASLIGVQVTLSGGQLVFDCYIPRNLAGKAVFSTSLGNLRGDTISDATPTADMILTEDGASPPNFATWPGNGDAPSDPWRVVELFDDQTSTTNADDISTAVTDDLTQGASAHTLTITATDIPQCRFGVDYGLGDTVTVSIRPGVSYTDIVSGMELIAGSDDTSSAFTTPTTGVQVAGASFGTYYEEAIPTIGNPAFAKRGVTTAQRLADQVRRIDNAIRQARKAGQ